MRHGPAVLLLAVALSLSLTCKAQAVAFTATVVDPNGPPKIWGKGVGDLNGDGQPDLVVGSRVGGLFWYENPGWTKRTISATAEIEEDLAIADLDRDGRRDVVAVGREGLTWFRNTPDGWRRTLLVGGPNQHDVVVADLDRDGKLDLAARNQGSTGNTLYFWRQVSLTNWELGTRTLPTGGEGLASTDIDRDGKSDLIAGEYWFLNTSRPGQISFQRHLYSTRASRDSYVATGDINGDGRVDIVTSPAEPPRQFHEILWFEAPRDPVAGGWQTHVIQSNVERVSHFVGVADIDLDGDLDVATALTEKARNPQIKVHLNTNGAGQFAKPWIIAERSSHSMKFVRVGSDAGLSLFGADYDTPIRTPVRLYRWRRG